MISTCLTLLDEYYRAVSDFDRQKILNEVLKCVDDVRHVGKLEHYVVITYIINYLVSTYELSVTIFQDTSSISDIINTLIEYIEANSKEVRNTRLGSRIQSLDKARLERTVKEIVLEAVALILPNMLPREVEEKSRGEEEEKE